MKRSSGHARIPRPLTPEDEKRRARSENRGSGSTAGAGQGQEKARNSGMPGGGAGRRDEVGRSGVYPESGPHPDDPNAPLRDQASWGQGARGAAGYNDSGTSEVFYMPNELPEDVVGQGKNQKNATGQGIEGEKLGWRGENQGEQGQQRKGGQGQKNKGQGQQNDPNREPGDQDLYNEDKQGNVFYDKNTEIKRETEFHDATATPVGNEPKVTQENDQFGKQKKK